MKRAMIAAITVLLLTLPAIAQKIGKPTKTGSEPTADQRELIDQGVKLHDEGQYEAAIAKYEKVLEENPDCVEAIYEIAFSYYANKDLDNGMKYALKGTEYKSELLPRLYMMVANIADVQGHPEKAVQLYKEAIKQRDLSILRYNLAVTYYGLKKVKEAREQAKRAVELENSYASPHFLLSVDFNNNGYKVPSVITGLRFLSLEADTNRARSLAAQVASAIDSGATRDKKSGNINIIINSGTPKDEGDFTTLELVMSMSNALKLGDKGKESSREERFISSLKTFVNSIAEDDKNTKTFCGKNYFGFFKELKSKGYTEVLGHLILSQVGSQDSFDWLTENNKDLSAFADWARGYGKQ